LYVIFKLHKLFVKLNLPIMRKKYFLFIAVFLLSFSMARAVEVTFQVQMDAAPAEGPYIWIPNYGDLWETLTDDNADLIYTYTVDVEPGTQLWYSYWVTWDEGEEVPAESRFHDANFRFIIVPDAAYTIPVVGYGQNPAVLPTKVNVTFKVELQGDSAVTNGMWMVNKNPWQWEELTHVGNGIFEKAWQPFTDQMMYYTFVYGGQDNWEGEESVPEECNFGSPDAPERRFDGASGDSTMPVIPFGECVGPSNLMSVTYRVNMAGITIGADEVVWAHINPGDLWPEMSDDDADGIYEVQMNHTPGDEIFYFYAYGTWDIWDEEVVPAQCADETTGHRYLMVGEEPIVLPDYFYGTCDITAIGELDKSFSIYPNPASDRVTIEFPEYNNVISIRMMDVNGRIVQTHDYKNTSMVSLQLNDLPQGIYFLQAFTDKGNFTKKILIEQ